MKNRKLFFLIFTLLSFTYFAPQSHAIIAQLVERSHGKAEVSGSNPDGGSRKNTVISSWNDEIF